MTRYDDWKSVVFGGQLVFGLVLFLSPWAIGFTTEQAVAWTAWITGTAVALVGIAALAGYGYAASWVNLVLGVWAILAPWIVGFAALSEAMWIHVVLGALVVLASVVELWMEHRSQPHVHA